MQNGLIVLFTDFGISGPYIGQMEGAIWRVAPSARVINLFADAPSFNPVASGSLLAAYSCDFPSGTTFLCVVDPGVGTDSRGPVLVRNERYAFVGPDNGLFNAVSVRHGNCVKQEILWRPAEMSNSFHGRDLFAPIAAHVAMDAAHDEWFGEPSVISADASPDLFEAIYVDSYGNVLTGVEYHNVSDSDLLCINGYELKKARVFGDVGLGEAFWYQNANGLVEIAVNQGSAAKALNLSIGDKLAFA